MKYYFDLFFCLMLITIFNSGAVKQKACGFAPQAVVFASSCHRPGAQSLLESL